MNNNQDDIGSLALYEPLKIQSSMLASPLLFWLIFGIIQGIRMDSFGLGIIGQTPPTNDYGLIIAGCLVGFVAIISMLFYIKWVREEQSSFKKGIYDAILTLGNATLMIFLLYCMVYRGLWSLSEFFHGFTIWPILKVIFFTIWGWSGYKSFCHLFQIKKFVQTRKAEELKAYIYKHQLMQFK